MNSLEGKIIEVPIIEAPQSDSSYLNQKAQRARGRIEQVEGLASAVGAQVEAVRPEPETFEQAMLEDLPGIKKPETVKLTDIMSGQTRMIPPFVIVDATDRRGRGNGKYLIETTAQLVALLAWANNYPAETKKVICKKYLEPIGSRFSTFRVTVAASKLDGQHRILNTSLWYGAPVDQKFDIIHPDSGSRFDEFGDMQSDSYLRSRAFFSNRHFSHGASIIDTGSKTGDRFINGPQSDKYLSDQPADYDDIYRTLTRVGGVINLSTPESELTPEERYILHEHGRYSHAGILEAAQEVMSVRGVVGDRVKCLYLAMDFHPDGSLLDVNTRPSPIEEMQAASIDRDSAQRRLYRRAILGSYPNSK
jgi:hypothetical protein